MEKSDLNYLLDSMAPTTLAKLAVMVDSLVDADMDGNESLALIRLSNAAYDAGIRNCGDDFTGLCFDTAAELAELSDRAEMEHDYNDLVAAGLARHMR